VGARELEEEVSGPLKVRAFFGLPVPEPQREALAPFIAECTSVTSDFRWTPPSNLHLTVRFVGSVESELVEGVATRLVAKGLHAFELELGDLGTFKRGRLVRVVWMGLRSGLEAARVLAEQVEAECVMAGLAAETRPFQAHLTLARARPRDGAALPALPAVPQLAPWRAGELVLYSSHLSRSGSVYEPLRSLPLLPHD
jgi:2'-5' RNA ligase